MKRFILVAIAGSMLIMAGCGDADNPANVASKIVNVNPVDYGNGVYYFPETKNRFANALSAFIANNPNLEVVTIASNGTGSYGKDAGYFVIFKKK